MGWESIKGAGEKEKETSGFMEFSLVKSREAIPDLLIPELRGDSSIIDLSADLRDCEWIYVGVQKVWWS